MLSMYLNRPLHTSWLVMFACFALVGGIVGARFLPIGMFSSLAWLLAGIAAIISAFVYQKMWFISFAVIGGGLIGLWRGTTQSANLAVYDQLYLRHVTISGSISDDIDINKRAQMVLRLNNVDVRGHHLTGKMWVTLRTHHLLERSDRVTLEGKVTEGFGTFAASVYDAKLIKVHPPTQPDVALRVRNWFAGGVKLATNEPQTSLGLGYLLGQRRGLPEALSAALIATGLTHVVVASGYNLTILVRLARRLFEKISKYLSFLASSLMILGFIAVTGMSPSMARAGLVAGLSLITWYYGRHIHPFVLLAIAMAITLFINPSYAWGDLGWQLSFAAFAGVMIVAPIMNAYFFGDAKEKTLRRILIETLSAQVCTLPIILYAFGQMSVIAPIANIMILPLVPLAMLGTFIAGIGGLALPMAAQVIGLPAELVLSYMTQTIEYMGKLPWAVQQFTVSSVGVLAMYSIIIIVTLWMWHKTKLDLGATSLVE